MLSQPDPGTPGSGAPRGRYEKGPWADAPPAKILTLILDQNLRGGSNCDDFLRTLRKNVFIDNWATVILYPILV